MKKLAGLLILLGSFSLCNAQEITVQQVQAPEKISFAQPFDVTYQLVYTPGHEVSLDEKALPADFEITQSTFTAHASGSGSYALSVIPFTLNKSTFTVTFLLTKDEKTETQITHEQPIEILPVKFFEKQELREVRAPHAPAGWLPWLIAAILTAATIYTIYYWANYRQNNTLQVAVNEDKRPCNEIALSKIDALLISGLWEDKAYKLFYISLSDILREYLWKQLHLDTSADTSAELLSRAKKTPSLKPLFALLKDFLNSGDLVKFAKVEPDETVRNKDIQILRHIIAETTPKPEVIANPQEGTK